jgi:phage terminase large subunit-like protein
VVALRKAEPDAAPRFSTPIRRAFKALDVPREDWGKPSGLIIAFAHSLRVPAGKMVNKPLRLRPFQIDFYRDLYNPRDEDGLRKRKQAILSIGRRGGKTLTSAVIVLAHLVGPFKRANSTIVSAATTRDQAALIHRYCRDMINATPLLARRLKVLDSTHRIINVSDGSLYRAISADAGGGFGQGIDVVIYDELAQARSRKLYDMLMTSTGSQTEPLMVIISTQAPANEHILSELIDYGLKIRTGEIEDDSFTVHLYTAPENCGLLDEKAWYQANPTLGDYRDLKEFREAMERAVKVPSLESSLRNLYLNQRVASEAPFLSPNVWARNAGAVDIGLFTDGRPVFGGLDLSGRVDLSALVLCAADDEMNVHLLPVIWTPGETLAGRATRDRAPYDVWVREGLMLAPPGSSLDYDFLAHDIVRAVQGTNLAKIAYDRWRIDILKQAFARIGIILPLVEHGMGFKDMSPAIDAFEELAIAGKLRHGGHPVLRWCISNTFIERDAAGNRKPTKARSYGRIDVAVAALAAVSAMKCDVGSVVDLAALLG